MKRKLIAVALAGLTLAPVVAQAEVTLYGSMRGAFENVRASSDGTLGAAVSPEIQSRSRVSSNSSYIGFKGSENLGNGLAAIWDIRQYVSSDQGGGAFGGSGLGNTFVGLKSNDYGTVLLGRHDTPYKLTTLKLDPFVDTLGDYNSIIGAVSFKNPSIGGLVTTPLTPNATAGVVSGGASGQFDLRATNAIAYVSPTISGFTGAIAYVANEGKANVGTPTSLNPYAWSLGLMYDVKLDANQSLYLSYGYEQHNDMGLVATGLNVTSTATTTGRSKDKANKLGIGYTYQDLTLGFVYEKIDLSSEVAGAANAEYSRKAYHLSAAYKMGPTTLKAAYAKADKGSYGGSLGNPVEGLGATQWTIGADYDLSKRTKLFAVYTALDNKSSTAQGGAYDLAPMTTSGGALGGISQGNDVKGVSVGIKHDF